MRTNAAAGTKTELAPLRAVGFAELLRDLPDMAVRVREGRSTHSPFPVDRAVEQLNTTPCQLRAHGIRVIHPDGELEPRPCLRAGDNSRLDQVACRRNPEQVDDQVLEPECRGVFVFVDRRQVEDDFVKRFRPLRVIDEQGDGANTPQRSSHVHTSFRSRLTGSSDG
jgi:hypothetical protein